MDASSESGLGMAPGEEVWEGTGAVEEAAPAGRAPQAVAPTSQGNVVEEARAIRWLRQAFIHGVSKKLFLLVFCNCLFVAACFARWPTLEPGSSGSVFGLATMRGAALLALGLYGFWVAVTNVFFGQAKIWPYLIGGLIALWTGVEGITRTVNSPQWGAMKESLKTIPDKKLIDDIFAMGGLIPSASPILALGGFLVLWTLLTGLFLGRSSSKTKARAQTGGGKSRRH